MTDRQKLTGRWLGGAGLAILVGLLGAASAGGDASQAASRAGASATPADASDAPAATVGVRIAEPVDSLLRERVYTGTLQPRRRSVLSFESAGKLVSVAVDEGDRVEQGQPLAALDTRRLEATRAKAAAELATAIARLEELIAGPRQQTIAAARADARSLAAQRDIAERRRKRRHELAPTEAISQEEYEEAVYAFRAAAARAESAQQVLAELEAGTRPEEIAAQRGQVEALRAQLADIDHQLEDAVLRAPFTGRVSRRRLDEGTVVAPGEPVIDLVEEDALEAWVGAPPSAAGRLEAGQSLPIVVDGQQHYAVVQSVRPELDPETRTQNVVLRLTDSANLVPGQVAKVALDESIAIDGFWTPTSSLSPGKRGLWSVLVVNADGVVAKRPVEVIENDGDRSFVRGTLQAGERVIVEGTHRVVPGQRVDVAPAEKP
ncbi:efflux RND transporter periplasmic adaptor subunit [Botrimarina sp.]|uniref:efflux RND transporter periplasmic adaptor subunit n=1 Tax=Botrimarina sp. TaxID=2795802 RepID=UPI0032EAF113